MLQPDAALPEWPARLVQPDLMTPWLGVMTVMLELLLRVSDGALRHRW
jgi:hypothetical protein